MATVGNLGSVLRSDEGSMFGLWWVDCSQLTHLVKPSRQDPNFVSQGILDYRPLTLKGSEPRLI